MKIFEIISICIGMVLPTIATFDHIKVANAPNSVAYNPKKINQRGVYQRYQGYAVISMIDRDYLNLAYQIEKHIQTSSFGRSYSALPANTYHITVYAIPNRRELSPQELDDRNKKAVCNLEPFQNKLLHIKYAKLNIGKSTISITVDLVENNLPTIRNGLATVYGNPTPKTEKFHITLAYVYGKMDYINMDDWNYLNWLVDQFNGASLSPPSVYKFESMKEYIPFSNSCRSQSRPNQTNVFRPIVEPIVRYVKKLIH